MTLTEIEAIEHLDFDHIPSCERHECSNEAKWRVTFSCCGHIMLWCDPCLVLIQNDMAHGLLFYCEACDTKNIKDPLIQVVPLL